jgi:hypothetical protein
MLPVVAITCILVAVVFLVLDDTTNPMTWINANTIWVAAAFVLHLAALATCIIMSKRSSRDSRDYANNNQVAAQA